MKSMLIAAAVLATLVPPAKAQSLTSEQMSVIGLVGRVIVAGTNGSCPWMKTIDGAVRDELLRAGVAPDDQMDAMEPALSNSRMQARISYSSNPAAFCDEMWHFAGPNGLHERQMLQSTQVTVSSAR